MKNLLILLFSAAISVSAFSQATPQAVVPRSDAAAVQKSVQELGKMFGVETPSSTAAVSAATPTSQKTIADVMDKAVDKVSDVVGAMAGAINKVAPDVWRIMLKQQYAKAIGDLIVPAVLALIIYLIFVRSMLSMRGKAAAAAKKMNADKEGQGKEGPQEKSPEVFKNDRGDMTEYGMWYMMVIVSYVVLGISLMWFGNRLADASKFLVNPEFYAIQDLLRMILSRSPQ